MRNKILSITIISFLALSSFGFLFMTLVTPVTPSTEPKMLPGPHPVDLSPEMLGEDEVAIRQLAAKIGSAEATQASPIGDPAEIGEEYTFTISDDGAGVDYDETFVVVLDGVHGIILITKDAYESYDELGYYTFHNPIGDASQYDRNDAPWMREWDNITHEQLEYMLGEFDNTIYPTDTSIFGEPLPRGDEGQKCWILILNIRDDAYYSNDVGSYIAGYFSASEDAENNKNMIHIDSYAWEDRTGPDSPRPFLYEGVFAHEFQHLIHFDQDPDEPSWVDEGCADMAMFMCGYGHPSDHIAYYFIYHEYISLTFWGGGLYDYGASYLFALYLFEHFGGNEFFTQLVQEQANGIEGIENTLRARGYRISFNQVFDNWVIANYIDEESKKCGCHHRGPSKYGYDLLEIGGDDTWGYTLEYALNRYYGAPWEADFAVESYEWFGDPQPYTAHYFRFTNEKLAKVKLDGDDYSEVTPTSGSYMWYSDVQAWAWRSFYQTFELPATGATLNFKTFFEIEYDWDYGYVEVHDLNTDEWYTLNDPSAMMHNDDWDFVPMADYVAYKQDNFITPEGREPMDYADAGRWHAFTGYLDDWIDVSMPFPDEVLGDTVEVYFTSWQDGAYSLQQMYVDDISIPEIPFSDDVEAGEAGWSTTGWYVFDGIFDNGWGLTLINAKNLNTERFPENMPKLLWKRSMWIWPPTQSGTMWIGATRLSSNHVNVAIITNHANHILYSHYSFSVEQFKFKWWKWWK